MAVEVNHSLNGKRPTLAPHVPIPTVHIVLTTQTRDQRFLPMQDENWLPQKPIMHQEKNVTTNPQKDQNQLCS
jgi:hypothetical protein